MKLILNDLHVMFVSNLVALLLLLGHTTHDNARIEIEMMTMTTKAVTVKLKILQIGLFIIWQLQE